MTSQEGNGFTPLPFLFGRIKEQFQKQYPGSIQSPS